MARPPGAGRERVGPPPWDRGHRGGSIDPIEQRSTGMPSIVRCNTIACSTTVGATGGRRSRGAGAVGRSGPGSRPVNWRSIGWSSGSTAPRRPTSSRHRNLRSEAFGRRVPGSPSTRLRGRDRCRMGECGRAEPLNAVRGRSRRAAEPRRVGRSTRAGRSDDRLQRADPRESRRAAPARPRSRARGPGRETAGLRRRRVRGLRHSGTAISARLAFETETINRAFQHDLVLFGTVTAGSGLVFRWRAPSGTMGPQFDDRELAIDWIARWLAEGVA